MSFPSVFTRTACFPLASEYARENVMNSVFKTDNFQFFVSECIVSVLHQDLGEGTIAADSGGY